MAIDQETNAIKTCVNALDQLSGMEAVKVVAYLQAHVQQKAATEAQEAARASQ